ncbi:MAG: DUF4348 domain-containing protein [Bacteroidales bacterium]|nr:DUF4348 domain-containing protein [Bacteroidales bacterium]
MKEWAIILVYILLIIGGCQTSKKSISSTPVIVTNTDSIRTEYIETVRIDTLVVEVPIPTESVSQVVRDSSSHVETSLAESDAWINDDGTLGHSIKNKPQKLNAEVPVPVKDTQTNNTASSIKEIPVPYPEPVYVEKSLTLWQEIRLEAFWYLLVIVILTLGWILRKPIVSVTRKLF